MSTLQRPEQTSKPKLLVVDDEPDNLDLLYRTFYREFKVLRAENGLMALETLESNPDVAVIISDQRMPGMSGTEFLRQTAVKYPNIMRIILTGYTDVEDLVDAINEGKVFRYVTKPWESDDLKAVVRQAMDTHIVLRSRTEELQRVLQQETLLNAITHTIRSAATAQGMMQTIVNTVGTLMEATVAVLHPYGETRDSVSTALYVANTPGLTRAQCSQYADQLVREVVEPMAWVMPEVGGWDALGDLAPTYQALEIQSTLWVPLRGKQSLLAVLALHHCQQPKPWQGSEMQLLVTMADQAALALSQAITYEQVQALARREQLLNSVTQAIRSSLEPQAIFAAITRELGQAIAVDSCVLSLWTAQDEYMQCVGLYEAEAGGATVLPWVDGDGSDLPRSQVPIHSNPVLQELLETQQPITLDDMSQHPEMEIQSQVLQAPARSLLVVPLMTEGQIIGSISLRHTNAPHTWHRDEIELAQAVAAQAAIAVQQSRLYQKTKEQTQQLIALDRQKTEFFQNISHEFRTPLTLTLGPLETAVSQGQGLNLEQSQTALRNARRLLRLVNQLLDLQRLDANRMQPTFRPINPGAFVDEIATAFRPYCDRKGITLHADLSPCDTIYIDLEKFDKVLYNLLSNAVKFTPEGGTITVSVQSQAQRCVITVSDTGVGIREDQLPYLFERFRQADGSTNRRYEGTGLGLALAKELVALHHGQIEVVSTYGAGTTFQVSLPLGRQHLPPEQVMEQTVAPEVSRAMVELADIATQTAIAAAPAEMAATTTPPVEGSILVVDDNADLRAYISNILQRQGYQVRTAHHGAAAIEMMQTFTPNLILTDLMMPGMSGLEMIQIIRQRDRFQHIPVVLLTAKVDDETRIEGMEQGADAYLGKPFNDRELLAEVRNLLALKANERRIAELNQYLTESVLRRFLPETLVTKAATGDLQLDLKPEPRRITVLFSDIVGFTPLSNQLGPRRLAQLLNEYLEAMTQAIFASGGTVDKFMGDGVLALFGAPEELPPKEQALRALSAVQTMHQALEVLNAKWQQEGMPLIQVRYGLHQGDAVVGMFGSAVRADYTAIGPCVNIASRLQEAAAPDAALVSWEMAEHLPAEHIGDRTTLLLRGMSEPLAVCNIQIRHPIER